jgi:hypothetical protein
VKDCQVRDSLRIHGQSAMSVSTVVKSLNVKYSYSLYPVKCSSNYFLFTEARNSPRIPTATFSHPRRQLLPETRCHKTRLHGLLNIPAACRCKFGLPVSSEMETNGFKTALKSTSSQCSEHKSHWEAREEKR